MVVHRGLDALVPCFCVHSYHGCSANYTCLGVGYVLNVAEEYEQYCVKHEVSNGVVKQDTKYIRGLYQDLSRNHQL